MNDQLLLKIEGLSKSYDDNTKYILKDFCLNVNKGDFVCVLGPSGCGKSTLIRCIAGFESFHGLIEVDGVKVEKPGVDRIMIFQDFNQLFPWKTVLHNITYPLKKTGLKERSKQIAKAEEYLAKVKMLDYKDYYPHQLSGGMKQRVAIAKGLALGSKIMLLDEPFAALDAMTRNQMQDELLHIKEKENMTVIFITHNIQEAVCMGNRIIVLSKNGTIREEIRNALSRPITPATKGYGEIWEHLNKLLHEGV